MSAIVRGLWRRTQQRLSRDDAVAMATAVIAMMVLTFLTAGVVLAAAANELASARNRGSAEGRAVGAAAFDDFYARLLANPNLVTDMFTTPTDYTGLGLTTNPNSPNWVQFGTDGSIVPCTTFGPVCWYLTLGQSNAGGVVSQQQVMLQVTVRAACRANGNACRFLRFQQTYRRRQFFDYALFQDRESVSGTIVPASQQGPDCTEARLLDPAAKRDLDVDLNGLPTGCLQVPFIGSASSGPTGSGGAAQDRLNGPMHTNDSWIYHCGDPYFTNAGSALPAVEATGYTATGKSMKTVNCATAGEPTFVGGYSGGAPTLTYPLSDQLSSIAQPINPGKSVRFDGVDDRVNLGTAGITATAFNQGSVELWFNAERVTGRQILYEEGGADAGTNIYLDGAFLYATAWTANATGTHLIASSRVAANTTYHVVAVVDAAGGRLSMYLNGVNVANGSGAAAPIAAHSTGAAIGAATAAVNGTRFHDQTTSFANELWFKGRLDEVVRYSTLLGEAKIVGHYQARSLGSTSYAAAVNADSPVSYWRFEETTGTTAAATGSGGVNGTYAGSPKLAVAPLGGQGAASTSPNQACSTASAQTLGNYQSIAPTTHRFSGPLTLTLNGEQIIRDNNAGAPLRLPSTGVIFVDGDLNLSGSLKGRLTIYATGRINITGDLTYVTTELTGTTAGVVNGVRADATSALGVIACKDVNIVWDTVNGSTAGRNLTGVFMSLTDTVWSDGWNTAGFTTTAPPKLTVHGAVVSKFRVVTNSYYNSADGAGGTVRTLFRFGLQKNFNYDSRLGRYQPPYFLQPVTAGWQRIDLVETTTGTYT